MFANRINIGLLFTCILLFYLGFTQNHTYSIIGVPFAIALSALFVMSPQVNWWYYSRNPPPLDVKLRNFISQYSIFYQELSLEGKQRFRDRVSLFMMAHEYMPMAVKTVPEDIKGIVAANAVHLTFGLPDYLMEKFEKIVIYPAPFPSPQFPRQLHASESYKEDGVVILAASHLVKGYTEPELYYNISLHEWIRVFLQLNPSKHLPSLPENIWQALEKISRFPKPNLEAFIGLPQLDPMPVAICYYLMFPKQFQEVLPEVHTAISDLLNLNPLIADQPIVYINESMR